MGADAYASARHQAEVPQVRGAAGAEEEAGGTLTSL